MCNAFRDRRSRLRRARHSVSEGRFAPFPSALAEQRFKELGRVFGREEMLIVKEFRIGNWDRFHHATSPLARGAAHESLLG